MAEESLGLLGENADLLAAYCEGLLDLIEDYFDDHLTSVKLYNPAHWHTQQLLFSV